MKHAVDRRARRLVEFVGLTGLGKTTLAQALARELEARGQAWLPLDAVRSERQRNAGTICRAVLTAFAYPLLTARLLILALITPPRRLRRLRRVAIVLNGLSLLRTFESHDVLLEEGPLQNIWSVLLHTDRDVLASRWCRGLLQSVLLEIIGLVGSRFEWTLVYLQAPADVALARIRARDRRDHMAEMTDAELLEQLSTSQRMLDGLVAEAALQRIAVHKVTARSRAEQVITDLLRKLEQGGLVQPGLA